MSTSMHWGAAQALAIGALVLQPSAQATTFDELTPVSMQTLDHVRGGFSMQFDFGRLMMHMRMTQFSMVNGVAVPDQATATGSSGGTSTVIQQGVNNTASLAALNGLSAGSWSHIIQNSQHDQLISSIRTVDIAITSQTLARTVNLQSLAQDALLKFLH